jgi:glycolate oxidase FAD binding subunit
MNARTSDTLGASQEIQSGSVDSQANISTICDVGFGAMTVLADSVPDDENLSFIGSVTGTITKYQSSYVIEKCPLVVKQNMDVFSDVGNSIELMRRIKNQYDPANTLNPGRFAGKI